LHRLGNWTLNWNPRPGCLLAATTAFIQTGQPASPARLHPRLGQRAHALPRRPLKPVVGWAATAGLG
jgi:hypothetical protein